MTVNDDNAYKVTHTRVGSGASKVVRFSIKKREKCGKSHSKLFDVPSKRGREREKS